MLLRGVVFGVAAEFALLIIWFAVEPYISQTIVNPDNQSITYQCLASYKTQIFFWILLVFNAVLLLAGCILSFKTRNVPSNFNESKARKPLLFLPTHLLTLLHQQYIALSIYNATLFIGIGVAIIAALQGSPLVMSLVGGLAILFATAGALGIIFLPKLYLIAKSATVQQEILATIGTARLYYFDVAPSNCVSLVISHDRTLGIRPDIPKEFVISIFVPNSITRRVYRHQQYLTGYHQSWVVVWFGNSDPNDL